ncbi:dihydrolipoamide dehydrogenase [Luteibacter sp. Sphag1AF]|uniref:dihydrolipoyl dehydrogenase n=1 Tax=Luteibacter sp. Sphag1AF TaxID=2587031 RepID=UPI00161C5A90|nr:dihydrolipoyl dehydrogenase [Luteibacter sp. Sphag1AF]MBB3227737.1 dihydrolipoamide dehydrogenase [Luteibacter sp. Sphag1AF]
MANIIELKVPDLGGSHDVPVIEILVKPGDTVIKEQSLITLESDKATMDIPASQGGTIVDIKIKLGDEVNEGTVIATIEVAAAVDTGKPVGEKVVGQATTAAAAAPIAAAPAPAPAVTAPKAAGASGRTADIECELVVLGSGPGGYTAAFRGADIGMDVVLIERYESLGGVCLNVGCIPSKALLHASAVIEEAEAIAAHGITFGKPQIDLDKLRDFKTKVVGKLTGGLASMAKQRKVRTVTGVGMFISPHEIEVTTKDGVKLVRFQKAIIAAGSQSVKLPSFPWDDDRVIDSTGALELRDVPKKLLVVGGGIIGLEMATVYASLGAEVTVVELADQLMPGADIDLVKPLQARIAKRYKGIHLKTKVVAAKAEKQGIVITFEGESIPETTVFDRVLVSVGRSPNGNKVGADKAGVEVTDRGFIPVDKQMRTNVPHIFAIGDLVGQPMLAHKATHEAKVAAEAAHGEKSFFDARVIPSVAYTDPEIAWVGVTEREAKEKGLKVGVGKFPWAASGRAIGIDRTEGFTKLIFDEETHRIVGAGIVGVHAGDLISELALAIEMGAEAGDIGRTVHPHPTLGESVGMAAEVYEGTITDLYIPKKK